MPPRSSMSIPALTPPFVRIATAFSDTHADGNGQRRLGSVEDVGDVLAVLGPYVASVAIAAGPEGAHLWRRQGQGGVRSVVRRTHPPPPHDATRQLALHRDRRHRLEQRGGVSTTAWAAEELAHLVGEAPRNREPDEVVIVVDDVGTRVMWMREELDVGTGDDEVGQRHG